MEMVQTFFFCPLLDFIQIKNKDMSRWRLNKRLECWQGVNGIYCKINNLTDFEKFCLGHVESQNHN